MLHAKTRRAAGSSLKTGLCFFQTFENIGMCIGVAPVIGVTLPFFSYGGSSIVALFAAMGMVSGIKYRPKPERFRSLG